MNVNNMLPTTKLAWNIRHKTLFDNEYFNSKVINLSVIASTAIQFSKFNSLYIHTTLTTDSAIHDQKSKK